MTEQTSKTALGKIFSKKTFFSFRSFEESCKFAPRKNKKTLPL